MSGHGVEARIHRDQLLASRLRDDGMSYAQIARCMGIPKTRASAYVKLGYRSRDLDELAAVDQEIEATILAAREAKS